MTTTTVGGIIGAALTPTVKPTLEVIKAKLPPAFSPIIDAYAPTFIKMTAEEVWSWILQAAKGDTYATHQALLAKMDNAALVAEWGQVTAAWQAANTTNVAAIQYQKDALAAVLRVCVAIAMAVVGF